MAYTKTKWTESTPITADKLNKIETGVGNALDATTGGTVKGNLTISKDNPVFTIQNPNRGQAHILFDRKDYACWKLGVENGIFKFLTNYQGETQLEDYQEAITLNYNHDMTSINTKLTVGGATNFNGDTTINKTLYVNGELKIGAGQAIFGRKTDGTLLSSLVVADTMIKAGNTALPLTLCSSQAPKWTNGSANYTVYTTGNKPTAADVGALSLKGGTVNGSVCAEVSGGVGLMTRRTTQDNSRTMVYASTVAGEHIFGGNNNGTVEPTDYIRVGVDKLKYETGGKAYDIYHSGNKPTAAAIGALPLSGGTLTGRLYVSGNSKTIGMGTGESDVFINNSRSGKYLQLKDNGTLSYDDKLIYHTGNFNPATKLDAGYFSISNRDLKVYGKRALVGHDTADGNHLVINYDRDFAAGVNIQGLLRTESIESSGKLAFSHYGTGGRTNANIHNLALQSATGNGQMMTAGENKIYVGNPQTPLILESNTGIIANIGGAHQRVLTERDQCNRFAWNGSRITIDNGGNNAAVSFSDTSEVARHIHNHHTGRNFKFRADAGLGPLEGEITFTW